MIKALTPVIIGNPYFILPEDSMRFYDCAVAVWQAISSSPTFPVSVLPYITHVKLVNVLIGWF